MPIIDSYDHLPIGFNKRVGFVYLLELSTDVVKIGSTTSPIKRLRKHRSAAEQFGISLRQAWLSEPTASYASLEAQLCGQARKAGYKTAGREWFRGLRFDEAVELAEQLMANARPRPLSSAVQRDLGSDALRILALALGYPKGKEPTVQQLYEHQRYLARTAGTRCMGLNRVRAAILELKVRGHYSVQRISQGRGEIETIRTFTEIPA